MKRSTTIGLDIAPPMDDAEIKAYAEVVSEALFFPGADLDVWVAREGAENIRVARTGGRVVGGLISQPMGQWFGGQSVPVGGIRAVGVAAEYRGAGAASALMRSIVEELQETGVPLSVLFPATQPVYRRSGYEQAGLRIVYRVPTASIDVRDRTLPVRRIEAADHDALREVYAARARLTAGNLDRNEWCWQRILDPPSWQKPYQGFLVERDGGIEGYLIFAQKEGDALNHANMLEIVDFVALTPDAARRLLTLLADHTSMTGHVTWCGPPNDPLLTMLAEQRHTIAHSMAWMLRMVDAKRALEGRGYARGVQVEAHLDVVDDLLPSNQRRIVLEVADGCGKVSDGGRGDVRIDIRGLAALYSGYHAATDLRTMGYAWGSDELLSALGAIFAGPFPWMPDVF